MKKFPTSLVKPFIKHPDLTKKLLRGAARKYITANMDRWKGDGESRALWLLSLRITDRCNHRCAVCGQYGEGGYNRDSNELPSVKGTVPVERYKQMIDRISELNPHIYITGGEPFLYNGLMDLCSHIKQEGLSLQVVTNGVKLHECAERMVEDRWDMICVSLDGPEDIHDQCRGVKGAFRTMERGLKTINEEKGRKDCDLPLVFLLTTLSSSNYETLYETVELAQTFSPDCVVVYYSWFTSENVGKEHEKIIKDSFGVEPFAWKSYVRDHHGSDFDSLKDAVAKVQEENWEHPVVFVPNLDLADIENYYLDPTDFMGWKKCLTPWVEANIMPNGDIVTCRDFPDLVMGNIKKDSLLDIYNNERFKKFRRTLAQQPNGVFPLCSRCCGLMGF